MIGVFYKYITRNLYFCKVKTKWQVELLKAAYFSSQQEGWGTEGDFLITEKTVLVLGKVLVLGF